MAFDIITPTNLGRGPVLASTTTFYTVSSLERVIVKTIDICNTGGSPLNVTVYLVPSGQSAATGNTIIPNIVIAANFLFQWCGAQVLNEGDTIQAVASATGTTINISGGCCT